MALIFKAAVVLLLVLSATTACCNAEGDHPMAGNRYRSITYHFGDASVPPEYHRSYTITITPGELSVIVNSYGEILADRTYKISEEQFRWIQDSVNRHKIRNCTLKEPEGCTGGTTEQISFIDEKNNQFSGSVYHCGGKDSGDLCGDLNGFANDVKHLVPDLETLLE